MVCRAFLVAALLTLSGGEALDWRAEMADALYLESGMGDLRAALRAYSKLSVTEGVPREIAAEATLRMGLAREALDEPQDAEAAYRDLLERFPATIWAADARARLQSLEEARKTVHELPVRYTFDAGVGGLFHAPSRSTKGRLSHEQVDREGELEGVVAWETYVIGGEDDLIVVGFDPALTVHGDVELSVHARSFPVHLSFFLVDKAGTRYGTTTRVVRPEQGWKHLVVNADDFSDRSAGASGGAYAARDGISYLMIQDATGYSSTDRGENLILIDNLSVR